jgi:hypothetical protein
MSDNAKDNEVKLYGKVAKLPKNANVVSFMESIKIPKNKLWYILVENQDNELHAIKVNDAEEAFKMNAFVVELKKHYILYFREKKQDKLVDLIEKIQIVGNDKFSLIKNIPKVKINEKMLITRITEDLIRLLQDEKGS